MDPNFIEIPLDRIDHGVNFIDSLILYRSKDNIKVCFNRCQHQGGRFNCLEGSVVKCPAHGWKLDLSTMSYLDPKGEISQLELETHQHGDLLRIYLPSKFPKLEKKPLKKGELTFTFFAHACGKFKVGSDIVFSDPWLTGPAFTKGWWLAHAPPHNWLDEVTSANHIYVSHAHSDHLNEFSMRQIAEKNPNVHIIVPSFKNYVCETLLMKFGLKNVERIPFEEWFELAGGGRLMILRDAAGKDDSGLVIEYKGNIILNTVDSQNLNNRILPQADLLLGSFASGASGFPVCWNLKRSQINTIVRKKRVGVQNKVMRDIEATKAKAYIPFAGYFTESHPADVEVKELNVKNNPYQLIEAIRGKYPQMKVVVPTPGLSLDLSDLSVNSASLKNENKNPNFSIEMYDNYFNQSLEFSPLKSLSGIQQYFDWACFSGDLVLHVIEMDSFFKELVREFYVDFSVCKVYSGKPNMNARRFLCMKVRSSSFRYVLANLLPWEDLSIGFQARLHREPDVYNFDFWNHFQDKLPQGSPWSGCDRELSDLFGTRPQ